jgi:hypothetical protein
MPKEGMMRSNVDKNTMKNFQLKSILLNFFVSLIDAPDATRVEYLMLLHSMGRLLALLANIYLSEKHLPWQTISFFTAASVRKREKTL